MRDLLITRPRYFYILFIPFMLGSLIVILLTSKSDLFLSLNAYHRPVADQFFFWITWLGNGLIFAVFCLVLLLKNVGQGILGFSVFLTTALVPQLLKKGIFVNSVRPVKYFEGNQSLHLIQGVEQHQLYSFPSGHSVSIFALALLLTFVVKDKRWGILFCGIAILTAYSRVYLSQHFYEDITAGAFLGFLLTLIVFLSLEKWIRSKPGLNKGIIK